MSEIVVDVRNLSKRFALYAEPWRRALEWASFGRLKTHEDFWALQDISFHVRRGECLGIIGANGAGKSTLLKILSHALYPTQGRFHVSGRLVSLLELGTGFHPGLSGRENVFNSARLLGFEESYIRKKLPDIVDFAELHEFIDRPIQIYSSGMYLRLAFSLFACLDPDVYVIDEALAVGDSAFQKKCVDRIRQMRETGVTILFVSHDLWRVEALCDRALYLRSGRLKSQGSPDVVVRDYLEDLEAKSEGSSAPAAGGSAQSDTPGGKDAPAALLPQFEMYSKSSLRICRLWPCGPDGRWRTEFDDMEDFALVLDYECLEKVVQPVFRIVIALPDERRVSVVGWHPGEGGIVEKGKGRIRWSVQGKTLFPRRYVLHASISTWDGVVYDTHYGVSDLTILPGVEGLIIRNTDDLCANLSYETAHLPGGTISE